MSGGRIGAGRQLERLFGVGTVGGLSDAELVKRFAAAQVDDEAAEAAFEVIVARHGPMILKVCQSVLHDAHAAEDVFQATFLVLARRRERSPSASCWATGCTGSRCGRRKRRESPRRGEWPAIAWRLVSVAKRSSSKVRRTTATS